MLPQIPVFLLGLGYIVHYWELVLPEGVEVRLGRRAFSKFVLGNPDIHLFFVDLHLTLFLLTDLERVGLSQVRLLEDLVLAVNFVNCLVWIRVPNL